MAKPPIVIVRRSGETAGILPEAAATLGAMYARPFHHEAHRVRHPLGIYNVSLVQVFERFETVIRQHDEIVKTRPFTNKDDCVSGAPPWLREFLTGYQQLLYALAEHVEDCYTILETCLPPGALKKHPARKAYLDATDEYRDHVGRVVNHIKHQHGRLRLVLGYDDTSCTLSYFVDGIRADGFLGPAYEVHSDGPTHFNVAVDLRFHFAHLYVLAHHLSRAIEAILGEGTDVGQQADRQIEAAVRIAEAIQQLPITLNTLHEAASASYVQLRRVGQAVTILIKHPEALVLEALDETTLSSSRIYIETDGVTRRFAFPHLD
jgi:hypothetical protein